MADVARVAGVSTATVSHYVNKTRRLLPDTENRVRDAIEELDYILDPAARTLRAGSSNVIGLAMSAVSNPYFSALAQELESLLSEHGKSILLMDTHDNTEREQQVVQELIARRVDGLVLAPSASADQAVRLAERYQIPLTLVDRFEPEHECDQAAVKSSDALAVLTGHLIELGHTRIGMITGERGLPTTEERIEGFVAAHRQAGLQVDEKLMISGQSTRAGGYAAADQLLRRRSRPTALVSGNNAMTIGTLRLLKERGVRVPADVAFVCFDDFEWADLFEPGLTAVAQPIRALAETTVDLLLSRIADDQTGIRRVQLEPTIMHRTSCGCLPGTPLGVE